MTQALQNPIGLLQQRTLPVEITRLPIGTFDRLDQIKERLEARDPKGHPIRITLECKTQQLAGPPEHGFIEIQIRPDSQQWRFQGSRLVELRCKGTITKGPLVHCDAHITLDVADTTKSLLVVSKSVDITHLGLFARTSMDAPA